ncbi:hypothetical protein BpHYR1_034965 [Brachionus plicatilis]|uniref:Uncharacterized protein n=1 Tax=Brachionus plicatilis TaxID=10195 RepID=A0A3M7S498_BRAPC|nr:hypothetical protein BpHYR1_034965 [Brachionus plicatilis]
MQHHSQDPGYSVSPQPEIRNNFAKKNGTCNFKFKEEKDSFTIIYLLKSDNFFNLNALIENKFKIKYCYLIEISFSRWRWETVKRIVKALTWLGLKALALNLIKKLNI